jgi:hypothetical protein
MKKERESMLEYHYNISKDRVSQVNKYGVYDDWNTIILKGKYIVEFHSNKVSEDTLTYKLVKKNGEWDTELIYLEEVMGCDFEDIEGLDMTSIIREDKLNQLGF